MENDTAGVIVAWMFIGLLFVGLGQQRCQAMKMDGSDRRQAAALLDRPAAVHPFQVVCHHTKPTR
jgi:hypothetical protein